MEKYQLHWEKSPKHKTIMEFSSIGSLNAVLSVLKNTHKKNPQFKYHILTLCNL